ncbi:hypothetical protein [Proteus vulgaris]|uniref:hypothetical protein n=1 Tax=Proteus vulgaris TaxID=585 RepID=UPI000F5145B0|nr:hypothetical protein [Proteus vulgaris]AYY80274.1 hypothetical protein EGX81_05070 [Proteus vulgaris]
MDNDISLIEVEQNTSDIYIPLQAWVEGRKFLSRRFFDQNNIDTPSSNWETWLSIQECCALYQVNSLNWVGLHEARKKTESFLENVKKEFNGNLPFFIHEKDREIIEKKIGAPPNPSLPIYLISCSAMDDTNEHIVYVGKTVNSKRFIGGHSAALKLLAPKYNNMKKRIYRATPWFYDGKDYISLDWINTTSLAIELLDFIESHLIYNLQPELNTSKKKNEDTRYSFYLHIQNFLSTGFLNDEFL